MTSTHGASSMSGPMCTTVSGLDETELIMSDDTLKKQRGIFVVKVQGLTIDGSTNPMSPCYGCMTFMRSSKGKEFSADEARVEFYRKKVQLPFTFGVREIMFSELQNGAPLEPHMAAASWCDGDMSQINAITKLKNIEFDEKHFLIDNKHSGARSIVEQSADMGGQCLSSKVMSKCATL